MLPRQMHLPLAHPSKYLYNRLDRFYPKVWPQVPQSHLKSYRLLCCVYALKGPCFGDLWHVHLKLKIRWSVVSENAATLVCWEAPQMLFGLRNVELFFFAPKQMSILRVKGTNLRFPNRAHHSLHAEAFNAESINSVGTLFFCAVIHSYAGPGWKQAFLIWLDEYKMQISGRGNRAGIK